MVTSACTARRPADKDLMDDDSAFPEVRVLRGISAADIAKLGVRLVPLFVHQGQTVVSHDDPGREVFFVLSGRLLAAQWTADGREIVFSRIRPGDHLGELAVLDGGKRSASVYAQVDSSLLRIDQTGFLALMDGLPQFRNRIIADLCTLIRRLTLRIGETQTQPVAGRLRLFLARLALDLQCFHPNGLIQPAPTHAEIGNSIGANREAVSRAMSALARQSIIRPARTSIRILKPDALLPEDDAP
jgi:CRP-like cAMP-binding protein